MKKTLFLALSLGFAGGIGALAQSNESVTSTVVNNILLGNYTPSTYQAATVITDPNTISAGLLQNISADSLKADLFALNDFQNRNTFSDTSSNTTGIGAARRWVYNKFIQYSQAAGSRLQVGYLKFTYNPASYPCTESPSIKTHYNVLAVLPGSQTTDKSLIIIEGHVDSRNVDNCDGAGSAPGIGDNATGTAMVMELARVMSRYTFRNTIVFAVNTGEEQGLIGAHALADYLNSQNALIKAVNNNDVSGGVFCGHTASGPGCPYYGNIDSIDLRVFSLGDVNSPNKQWARYIKLEYKEQLSSIVSVPMAIQIMENDDRVGRGGDHQAFTDIGYTAVRFTQANEDGDANSSSPGYTDRQHSVRDSLGHVNSAGAIDSIYLDPNYLARNALVNANSLAMVALGPDTITLKAGLFTANTVKVQFSPAGAPAYRVAIRSTSNDWDSVYTITGTSSAILSVPYATNTTFYISAAAVDANGTESQFSTEYTLSTGLEVLYLAPDSARPVAPSLDYYGIQLLPNRPNPFDESTLITINSGTDMFANRTCLLFTGIDGRVISRIPVILQKGINQVVYNHGFGAAGIYICSLLIDGLPVQSTKMIFTRH
ncbi:MAG TPA: M28 family peptidase [Puia sp.]|nr:M28 family peptidase [Puia sp.]